MLQSFLIKIPLYTLSSTFILKLNINTSKVFHPKQRKKEKLHQKIVSLAKLST